MDFSLTDDEAALQQLARDFAAKEIRPHAARYWEEERCPTEVLRAMGNLGLLGLLVPEEWGGAGVSTTPTTPSTIGGSSTGAISGSSTGALGSPSSPLGGTSSGSLGSGVTGTTSGTIR